MVGSIPMALSYGYSLIALLSLAMGLQNAPRARLGVPDSRRR